MAYDKVKIGNMALSHIGSSATIESFDENSTQAKQIKLWYDSARQQCLSDLDWNFARKRLTLTQDADDAPETEWIFRYQYPTDGLAIRRLENPGGKTADAVPFEVENNIDGTTKTILTDLEDAVAVYTFDLDDEALFTPLFANALSLLVAHYIALTITGKQSIQDKALQRYYMAMRIAEAKNANEHVKEAPRDPDWIRGRA